MVKDQLLKSGIEITKDCSSPEEFFIRSDFGNFKCNISSGKPVLTRALGGQSRWMEGRSSKNISTERSSIMQACGTDEIEIADM